MEETIQKILLLGSLEKAKMSLGPEERLQFLKDYNLVDPRSYDEVISAELEMADEFL